MISLVPERATMTERGAKPFDATTKALVDADPLLQGVRRMRESSTYQAVLAEGRAEGEANGARRILLRLGAERFGLPDARVRAALEAVSDPGRLEALAGRLHRATSWEELLSLP